MTTKELRVNYILPVFIGFIISILFGSLLFMEVNKINNFKKENYHLNTLIKKNVGKDGKKTYLKVKSISPMIAKNDNNNGYYIVSDEKYNYIVLLTSKKADELVSQDLEKSPVTVYGISKEMTDDLKNIVIEKYNLAFEEKITLKDYYSYFGDLYLDQTLVLN